MSDARTTNQSTEYAYIVLDHAAAARIEAFDGYGKRYIHLSPAHLGDYRLSDPGLVWVGTGERREVEIPIYRREDMPDGWPERWVKQ
jgi:hypothetical protein